MISDLVSRIQRVSVLLSNAVCFMEEQEMSQDDINEYLGTTTDELIDYGIIEEE